MKERPGPVPASRILDVLMNHPGGVNLAEIAQVPVLLREEPGEARSARKQVPGREG
jgi:hypothetical protein